MSSNIEIFLKDFLGASTWGQRKDGVPLDLLDNLTPDELKTAELELIKSANLGDTWPIIGLGHIKSTQALPALYSLLDESKQSFKVTIAYSIFQICKDEKMIGIVLQELPKITNQYELIAVLYMLPAFTDDRISVLLNNYRDHKEYLVAYNATRALGLSTDEVVKKFSAKGYTAQ